MRYLPGPLLTICLSFVTMNTYSEVIFLAETGFILENKIQVAASPEVSWKAFTQRVGDWWPSDHTWWGDAKGLSIESFAGGCFCEKSGDKSAEHMHITFVDPNRAMRMTGGLGPLQGMGMYGALDWVFEAIAEGTAITMTYRVNGISEDGLSNFVLIVDQVQAIQLGGLKSLLEN